ncbi:MAG: TlpA disulfide reductase family protein [Burkholderiaceae bacterium]
MIGVGPFSVQSIVVGCAVFLAWFTARRAVGTQAKAPRKAAGGLLLDAVFWGFVAGRLAYIAWWWEEYSAAPKSMVAIGDGGFAWWVGIPVAAAYLWWRTRSIRGLRNPTLTGLVTGVVVWVAANSVLSLVLRSAPPMPDLQLMTLEEHPVTLHDYAGRPVVLNLWASWCPPCRREMPAFQQAEAQFPRVAFVMLNQGESPQQAQAFLEEQGLALKDVLLDPASSAMRTLHSRGLPTTLFFDENGRLVDTHLGELTLASLKSTIARRFDPSHRAPAGEVQP